ncbi:MAG: TetR family transcriptional regulator C-terminal domain-containing protein, partial [Chloroflexi bacterium]|nr:TetR family transcriptional regulator C-terminal domain-containing protein [Chloroflexota bacterium]
RRALARAARTEARRSARDALRGLFIESLPLDGARRLEWTIWVAFIGSAVAEPGFASEQERRYIGWRDHILALLQRARAEGALRPNVDLPAAADRLAATLDGAGIRALFDPKGMSPRRLRAVMEAALGEILRDTPATTIR